MGIVAELRPLWVSRAGPEWANVHGGWGSSQLGWAWKEYWSFLSFPWSPWLILLELPASPHHSLEGQGEVILAGLTVAHQVAGLFAEPEQVLGICSTDGPMVPAEDKREEGSHLCWVPRCPGPPILGVPCRQASARRGREGRESPTGHRHSHLVFQRQCWVCPLPQGAAGLHA